MPKPTVRKCDNNNNDNDKLLEKLFVINCNLKRRHLNSFQRVSLALKAKPILKEIAKRNESLGGMGVRISTPLGRVDEQIGKYAGGVGKDTVRKVETILKKGTEEQIKSLEHGKTTINSVAKQIHNAQKRQELILLNNNDSSKRSNLGLPENNIKLLQGDFTSIIGKTNTGSFSDRITILDNSIPLIFTDPPYKRASLPLYRELGKLASTLLMPGGSLMVMSGQLYLPEVLNMILESKELQYWWSFAVIYHSEGSSNRQRIFARKVFQEWKHLLWFVKGRKIREGFNYIADSIKSARPHKYLHEWQQSTDEVEYIIRGLTVENEVILDRMLGSGTTAIALKLNRRFIGIEIQKDIFNIAKSRISRFVASSTHPILCSKITKE